MDKKIISLLMLMICSSAFIMAQDDSGEKKVKLKLSGDLVSSYIFRGVLATPTPSPNFQPTLAAVAGNLEVGTWGSTDFIGSYREVDLYATYTAGPIAITATDYFFSNQGPNFLTIPGPRYFTYGKETTGHIVEAVLTYTGPESFLLSVFVGTFLYGNDKKFTTDSAAFDVKKNNYSTYIELSYRWKGSIKTFIGATPWNGYYGAGYGVVKGFGIVNLGVSATRTIEITEKFSLPVKASFYCNPQAEQVHLVLGVTL